MRTPTILNNSDASIQIISEYINFDQRAAWKLFIESIGLDGIPKLFIQEATTKSDCTPPIDWTIYKNNCSVDGSYNLNDILVTIEKNDFKSNWFRVLIEPNGNTTGTISARVSYKTFT
tara:strand:- start:192 stop:545 length:354 start_codon:yes stop_codon:yes gene_type:complete